MFDSVSSHIPLKIKEKVWAGEYIDMSLMLKSGKDLVYVSQLNGELAVKYRLICLNCKTYPGSHSVDNWIHDL
jgi:hypothetical protein